MATITKDTIVGDILDIAPETAPAFIDIGMHCLGCPPPGTRPWSRPAWSMTSRWKSWWRSSTPSSRQTASNRKNGSGVPLPIFLWNRRQRAGRRRYETLGP